MDRLVKALEAMLTESEAASFEVGEQREINYRYYSLQPLGNEVDGRSQYISPDVIDSVESKKALFAETFFSGRRVVRFKGEDKQDADAKTAYVERQLKFNSVHELFRDGWHDAFVAKKMTVVADWKEDTDDVVIELKDANQMTVMKILEQMSRDHGEIINVDVTQLQVTGQDESGPVSSGPMTVSFDSSHTDLYLIPPENAFRDPSATYVRDGQWFTYREDIARGDLLKMGVSEDQVDSLTTDYRFRQEEEDSSRKAHDRSWTRRQQHKRADNQELVSVYRTFAWLDLADYDDDLGGESQYGLFKICWTSKEILRYENDEPMIKEVPEMPVFEWTEYKISHAENGMADADLTVQTQKVQSTLKRLIIDNQQMRNTTRYEATIGAVKNPRELIDNNIGGTVWTRRPGLITPLATPELSPLTLSVIQMLNLDKESRSGMSSLSKGMNMDAISNQNAADMIEKLTSSGQRRVMRAARDFAQTFMIPLCQYVYKLGVRNDKRTHKAEVAGKYQILEPAKWPDMDMDMEISVALTPDECERHAKALIGLYQFQMMDPDLKMGFGYAQKHALLDEIYDCLGVPDSSAYLLRPDSPEYQKKQQFQAQQMQAQQQQMQMQMQMQQVMQQKQMEMQMTDMQFNHWIRQSEDGRQWSELQIQKARADMDARNIIADNIRDDEKLAWEIEKGQQEIDIERSQKRGATIG